MRFRTEYIPDKAPFSLWPEKPVVLMGSCFSQNIASKMEACGWKAVNPGATLYNPGSILEAVEAMCDYDGLEKFEKSLFFESGVWKSFMFGTSFSSLNRNDSIAEFEKRRQEFHDNLSAGGILIVTYGTSICYHLKENGGIVGNCHKLPSERFYQQRMKIEEVVSCGLKIRESIKNIKGSAKIIFTVSPVRHLKDGFIGNNRSKSILSLGVEEICKEKYDCHYFPAYEILNDDLRDYRFYASDLCHPSEEAVDYIWEKFKDTYLDSNAKEILERKRKEIAFRNHRPLCGALGKPLERI